MNEQPEGTPNPLNPSPASTKSPTPSASTASTTNSMPTSRSTTGTSPAPAPNRAPSSIQVKATMGGTNPVTATETPTTAPGVAINGNSPMERPMEQAVPQEAKPVKKSKKAPLIAGIVALFVAVGCGVAAALIAININKADPVTVAMNKLASGENKSNLAVKGTIDYESNDSESPFSSIKINLNSEILANSPINSTVAEIVFGLRGGDETFSLEFDEMYMSNGDLYLRVDGIASAMSEIIRYQAMFQQNDSQTELELDESLEAEEPIAVSTNDVLGYLSYLGEVSALIDSVDGTWLRISSDNLNSMISGNSASGAMSCLVEFSSNLGNSSNSISELYNKYPYVSSTNENLPVESRNNPIYRISFDTENMTKFLDEASGIKVVSDFYDCMGYENAKINTDNVVDVVKNLPDIYVEIDNNYNFTRLYFNNKINDNTDVKVDLDLSYPTNVNITEPNEYQDLMDFIVQMSQQMYQLEEYDENSL